MNCINFLLHFCIYYVFLAFYGCGPGLSRPGFKPPVETPPIKVFQDAENQLLQQLQFSFVHNNFDVLNGILTEIRTVFDKYPPSAMTGVPANPVAETLQIEGIVEQVFLQYMQSKNFENRDLECVRDYTKMCPERWVDVGDGRTCESPPELFQNDQCKNVTFGGLTPLQKSALAWNCGQSFYPCRNACKQNFSQLCPIGWQQFTPQSTFCVAPPTYIRPCVKAYNFADHSWTLKRKFAEMCKVDWPCMGDPK